MPHCIIYMNHKFSSFLKEKSSHFQKQTENIKEFLYGTNWKKSILPHILAAIFHQFERKITGVVGDIKTELWSKIYAFETNINQVTRLSLEVQIYSLFLYVLTCWIGSTLLASDILIK